MHKQLSKNFNSSEFDSPDLVHSGKWISMVLVEKLQLMRNEYGKAINVLSGVRTYDYNVSIGGVLDSEHVNCHAADIEALTSRDMFLLVSLAIKFGFTRIGINNNSLHLGVSQTKPQNVIWTYYN